MKIQVDFCEMDLRYRQRLANMVAYPFITLSLYLYQNQGALLLRNVRPRLALILILVGAILVLRPLGQWMYAYVEQYRLGLAAEDEDPVMEWGETELPSEPTPDDEDGEEDETPPEEPPRQWEYEPGDVVGRILIPKLEVDALVVYGTDLSLLARAPGIYPQGSLPGEEGNLAIAGHRTTYGAWFRHIDQMEAGDQVIFIHEGTQYIYQTERVFTVASNDWTVIHPTDYQAVTLTSCHPPGSARERIILRGRLYATGEEETE